MEPLLYFILAPQNITGIGANFARIFQFIVVASLCLKLFSCKRLRIPNFFSSLNKNFTYYFIFVVLAGFLGLYTGSYSFNIDFSNQIVGNSIVADFIRSHSFRPFFEYFIAFYYFAYFVVLAGYMLTTKEAIDYFFKLFFIALSICMFVGFLDLLLQLLIEGRESFPRHFSDININVGFRFHGIAGEPRDAFSYLMLSLGILALRDIWEDKKKLTLFWIILITTATLLTQSFSGILGIAFFGILVVIYYLPFTSSRIKLLFFSIALLVALAVFINTLVSDRLMRYYYEFFWLYSLLELGPLTEIDWSSRCNFPNITECDRFVAVFKGQMSNIYPIWHLWEEIKEFNFLHLFIGNGLGSTSIINNYYMHSNGLENPHAGIIRSLYETGIIGTLFFIAVFLTPIKKMYMNNNINSKLIIFMLLMLGMYFAHRSAIPYIFLGTVLVVLNNKLITSNSTT
jgi:O-antigen ligase